MNILIIVVYCFIIYLILNTAKVYLMKNYTLDESINNIDILKIELQSTISILNIIVTSITIVLFMSLINFIFKLEMEITLDLLIFIFICIIVIVAILTSSFRHLYRKKEAIIYKINQLDKIEKFKKKK